MLSRRTTVLAGVALLAAVVGMCAIRGDRWHWQAQAAVVHAVESSGPRVPDAGIVTRVSSAALTRTSGRPLPIEILSADNELAGASWADVFSPGVYVAHLRTSIGQELHAEAFLERDGSWRVSLQPEERRP